MRWGRWMVGIRYMRHERPATGVGVKLGDGMEISESSGRKA